MDCSQVKQMIPQWLDDEMEPAEAALIAAHVENCQECQDEKAFWQVLGTTLRDDLGDIKAPPGFTTAVMSQLTEHRSSSWGRFITCWKRNLAVAATFLLVAAGSVGAYMQMGGNIAWHVARGDDTRSGHVNLKEPNPDNNVGKPGIIPVDSNNKIDREVSDNLPPDGEKVDNDVEPNNTQREPAGIADNTPSTAQTGNNTPAPIDTSEQYAFLNTEQNRVIDRTLVRVKVEDINAAHKQALSFVNSSGAQYEVLGSESAPGGGQETLKVVVNSNLSSQLQGEFKTLGQVVTTDTQRDDLNSRYNEKVEQYRSLQAQAQAAKIEEELKQLQVKMAGIEAQLRAWDREANTDTIILWLEN
ncbi:zf-HC2 domain-containing protein [Desulfoscipio gibsoniae]|uniref:Anti-sigma-W factor RsiW n=1 Tax=Desulfoscipio gibsoniae DSM 7213 TaxID=767817 RepID=R4KW07_9FIRM|nr:zf-HC2 domain-containing protein [Desulfoscipio gibsoniae]AGL03806.1 hypothetical protein Desgi_4579 [Desulfoscipio gibsoniae DSM 7213]